MVLAWSKLPSSSRTTNELKTGFVDFVTIGSDVFRAQTVNYLMLWLMWSSLDTLHMIKQRNNGRSQSSFKSLTGLVSIFYRLKFWYQSELRTFACKDCNVRILNLITSFISLYESLVTVYCFQNNNCVLFTIKPEVSFTQESHAKRLES